MFPVTRSADLHTFTSASPMPPRSLSSCPASRVESFTRECYPGHGVGGLLRNVSWRALQIYIYYLIASLVTILVIVVSRDIIAIPENHQALIGLREDPLAAIKSAILLISPPDLPGILVLYLELTLFAIPMFLLIAARSSAAALLTSGGLWLLAQFHPDLFPRLADNSFFNPIAWQLIFCIGMFVGTWYHSDTSLEPFRRPPWVLLACTVVGVALLYRIASKDEAGSIFQMKENLSAIRLVHFLSVAFLVAIFVRPNSPIFHWPGASALIKTGRCSLQVFCAGVVLSVLLNLFIAVEAPPAWERIILDCLAIMLIASMATALIRSRHEHQLVGAHSALTPSASCAPSSVPASLFAVAQAGTKPANSNGGTAPA
jgi:hypothetical protein